jgi:hypothetical protein
MLNPEADGTSPVEALLTVREAVAVLRISEKTLWSLSQPRGPIPVVRLGRTVRYDPADLREHIRRAKQVEGGASAPCICTADARGG